MSKPTSAARPKRAGEDFNRTHDNSNKKPRFDHRNPSTLAADARDEEEDLILNADVIGKSGAQPKRNAVNIDGYESDSDNDNFNARAAEREKRGKKSVDEEDDDMFADLAEEKDGDEDEEVGREGKSKKKDVKFLDPEEIEGQVMNSTSGGRVSSDILLGGKGKEKYKGEEDSESSGDEEERDRLDEEMEDDLAAEIGAGGKKKHAPRLDAFNLKAEEEEGRYDESGNYVRKAADPDAVNDNWMDGLTKKDMKRAREAQERREDERRKKALEDDAVLTSDLLSTLIGALETGETPLEALQRLNKGKTKEAKVPKWKLKRQRGGMDVDEAAATNGHTSVDPAEEARRKTVDAITGAADGLYARGQHEIYDAEREVLMRQYRRETGEDWQPPRTAEPATWEYRWSDARDGGDIHGPYDAATMKAWSDAGYFGEGVEFRRGGEGGGEWSRLLDLDE
ncbi:hypothetical protein M409DRAFT_70223 [Zasmidium cellare ATCC 36951]|uniref:GYF domain-containing protein n=1 Tax=Zasmidium cellare ATCC 36951 TaxID=1080233 RepID=A0A6A6C3B3_ZASCE|nr:uncharacterized protein M409DRAFT_70223 [Zasmidium cellare ATCC 36951]KAF2160680.1 hypothetical protein M409DRAFT_70223 [Zasmidium cellare ATCC 36951]